MRKKTQRLEVVSIEYDYNSIWQLFMMAHINLCILCKLGAFPHQGHMEN